MKLLLVEDVPECVADFESTLKRYNAEKGTGITFEVTSSVDETMDLLDSSFDGAIIDLKLNDDEDGGNKVIAEIQRTYRIPIVVLTGTPSHLASETSPLLGLCLRDDGYDPVLKFLSDIYKTGLTQILGGRGVFEKTLNDFFWNNIPDAIEHFISGEESSEMKQVQLLRYTISHMNELLEHTMGATSNSAETYIYPPIRQSITEGGIIKEIGTTNLYVVLTPACDISNGKAEYLQIVRISGIKTRPEVIKLIDSTQPPSNKLKSTIQTFVRNKSARFHYLPKFGPISQESLVDFQDVKSVLCKSFSDNYEFQGNISGTFYKDLVNRFSSNYSRQGSPDYNFSKEESNLLSDLV
jgi:CheY-like chemotaxis protein